MWAPLLRVVAPLHVAAVLALACLIILVPDEGFDWNRAVLVLAGAALAGGVAMGRARIDVRSLIPYACYAAALLAAWWAHPSAAGTRELWQQAAFFGLIAAVAPIRRPAALTALLVAALALVSWQVLGPSSVAMLSGRALHLKSVDQWGGYPEIGLLVAAGAGACTALVVASRRLPLRIAAGVLIATFTAAAQYIYARSAVLTILLTAAWLVVIRLVQAAPRRRGWLLAGAAGVGAAVCLVVSLARPADVRRLTASIGQSQEVATRVEGWRVAAAMLRDHPLFGVGPGRYPEEYARYSTRQDPAHAYNIFFHTAAELGLCGLLAYVALWTRVLALTLTRFSGAGLGAFAAHGLLVAFLIRCQSEHFLANLSTSYRALLLLGLVFGLAEACARASSVSSLAPGLPPNAAQAEVPRPREIDPVLHRDSRAMPRAGVKATAKPDQRPNSATRSPEYSMAWTTICPDPRMSPTRLRRTEP
jgi:O-antigen ligase